MKILFYLCIRKLKTINMELTKIEDIKFYLTNNKKIATFMGWYPHVNDGSIVLYKKDNDTKHIVSLKYHTSWDLLMPVLDKIESLNVSASKLIVSINNSILKGEYYCTIDGKSYRDGFYTYTTGSTRIEATYKAVILFIEWYNTQKKG